MSDGLPTLWRVGRVHHPARVSAVPALRVDTSGGVEHTSKGGFEMTPLRLFATLLGLFISLPTGLYLQYRILVAVDATPVMWLLFWFGMPVTLFVRLALELSGDTK
jgi:hypothetical protein